tara:strand:- start:998 stop:1342 length:345 start_codon:yes stop_codon:yes gene_type:complete
MWYFLISFCKKLKQRRVDKITRRRVNEASSLALRKYKIAVLELYNIAGSKRRRLILAKTKAGTLWSKKQYNKILIKSLEGHPHLDYSQCTAVINYLNLSHDFTYWSKIFFLKRV